MNRTAVVLISSVAALSLSLLAAFFMNRELSHGKTCGITEIYSGDTLEVVCEGETQKVKLCNVNVPNQAKAKGLISSLVENIETISVVFAGEKVEIFLLTSNPNEEKMLSQELLMKGFAKFFPDDNCPNSDSLKLAEDIAKQNRVGIWK